MKKLTKMSTGVKRYNNLMKDHLNINQALRVYDKIVSKGNKQDDKYVYQGLSAWSDFDGYTIILSNGEVNLSIYFHNKFEIEHKNSKSLNSFLKQIDTVDKQI